MNNAELVVIYDGECPLCKSYVHLMALRDRVGTVQLVNARSEDIHVKTAIKNGCDLNDGSTRNLRQQDLLRQRCIIVNFNAQRR